MEFVDLKPSGLSSLSPAHKIASGKSKTLKAPVTSSKIVAPTPIAVGPKVVRLVVPQEL